MSGSIGERAVVVGAGVGGLVAARALADHFDEVVVLERDALPQEATPRSGTAQSRHTQALLVGGLSALEELFPGIARDLADAGAVPLRAGLDVIVERPGYDPFPQRDLEIVVYSMSRPLIELVVRRRLGERRNVVLREGARVGSFAATPDGSALTAVRYDAADGKSETLPFDLAIDASGRGALTLDLLKTIDRSPPEETVIGIDIAYATAIFAIPEETPADFKGAYLFPDAPQTSRGALLLPIEGGRWILTLVGAHGDAPPADHAGFLAFAQSLRRPTVFEAIRRAALLGPIARFAFPGSVRRHFERLADFPRGLLPLADAACRFNPVYGQGMSVAAQEACLLRRLLGETANEADPLARLASTYFAALPGLLEAPWSSAALDLIYPQTTGARPPDFEGRLRFGAGLIRLAARDGDVHKLFYEVNNLIKPPSAYRDPDLQRRVMAALAEA